MHSETRKGRELLGMPVYAVAEGRRLGEITGLLVRPSDSTVAAIAFGTGGSGRTHYLEYPRLRVVGVDAVMIDSEAVLKDELPLHLARELDSGLSGRPVITEDGQRLGTILGICVNTASGRIEAYRMRPETGVLAHLAAAMLDRGVEVPLTLVRSLGRDALVVDREAPALLKGEPPQP